MTSTNSDDGLILIGMDDRGAIISTERLTGLSPDAIRNLSEERLKSFAMVEVLQGARRILFLERDQGIQG